MALTAVVLLPLLAALLCWIHPFRKAAWIISVVCLCLDFVLAVVVSRNVVIKSHVVALSGWLDADGLSALMLVLVSFVCALATFFAGDYMRHSDQQSRVWWFYCNLDLFAFALIVTPALSDPNLVWVGVELITLFAILLVSFETTANALEAAWKYSMLTMMGAPISLLGFLVLFWAYRTSGAQAPETWTTLSLQAASMPANTLRLAFLLVFVGFGAKVGLTPMHTWLPDAHSQAPSPACAVLSGVKTSVPLYAILRLLSILLKSSPTARMSHWMVVIGLLSVAVAAFLLLQVRDYKRMFAYSTVEHMGIILTAAGFATQTSDLGAVSQMLNHSITKSLCFYVAGAILVTMTTREIKSIRGLLRISPFSGATLLLCGLAIAGAPPFPIFLSEFSILSAGVRGGHPVAVAMLASLIVIAFVGIMLQVNRMAFGRPHILDPQVGVPRTCRIAILAAALPVVVLGVYIPGPVHSLLLLAAQQLGGR